MGAQGGGGEGFRRTKRVVEGQEVSVAPWGTGDRWALVRTPSTILLLGLNLHPSLGKRENTLMELQGVTAMLSVLGVAASHATTAGRNSAYWKTPFLAFFSASLLFLLEHRHSAQLAEIPPPALNLLDYSLLPCSEPPEMPSPLNVASKNTD